MLLLKPNCAVCDVDLPGNSTEAMICSFECTYCRRCAEDVLHGICPTCGGEVQRRPLRRAEVLERHPASTERQELLEVSS